MYPDDRSSSTFDKGSSNRNDNNNNSNNNNDNRNDRNFLGGSGGGTAQNPLTLQQLREQRLARFVGGGVGVGGGNSSCSNSGGLRGPQSTGTTKAANVVKEEVSSPHGDVPDSDSFPPSRKTESSKHDQSIEVIPSSGRPGTATITSSTSSGLPIICATELGNDADNNNGHVNVNANSNVNACHHVNDSEDYYYYDDDDDEDEAELQAALALSLVVESTSTSTTSTSTSTATTLAVPASDETCTKPTTTTTTGTAPSFNLDAPNRSSKQTTTMDTTETETPLNTLRNPQHLSGRIRTWYSTAQPTITLDFHQCMWDASSTQRGDQERWLAECIQFKHPQHDCTDGDGILDAVVSSQGARWGLTQKHGGPCGVLASIQAELLRILLFGSRSVHPISMLSLDLPTSITDGAVQDIIVPDMSPVKMRQALALSIGIILARAASTPSAMLHDDAAGRDDDADGAKSSHIATTTNAVKLVLPRPELWDASTCLEWDHLEPWHSRDSGDIGLSEHLMTYTISLPSNANQNLNLTDGSSSAVKRQKRLHSNAGGEYSIGNIDLSDDEDEEGLRRDYNHRCAELAHATAQFLLETFSLSWFQRPGGVLLVVMSLAMSRGIPVLHSDMDDQTANLTSNFGHCSQELINLLLTGQAVSNVFDNTLRPSGDLICRGVQIRPSIGYLTQLEAMRYLEVGGYYKRPTFPIWVVGSSSHFTVLFGDAVALEESASDALLEKARRAFKGMGEGAEENGFIQTTQLGDFLHALGLKIPDHGVQTLAATMEAYGAGIILWEELWKRTSRLMTGARLESVLEGSNDDSFSKIAPDDGHFHGPVASVQSSIATAMSDEEIARRLQAEWNGEAVNLIDQSEPDTEQATFATRAQSRAEEYGQTFLLYHYNGLRGGIFKSFEVTRLSANEAIGASVSLGDSSQTSYATDGFRGGLEDVLRTKWPSCKIDWMGSPPPSID